MCLEKITKEISPKVAGVKPKRASKGFYLVKGVLQFPVFSHGVRTRSHAVPIGKWLLANPPGAYTRTQGKRRGPYTTKQHQRVLRGSRYMTMFHVHPSRLKTILYGDIRKIVWVAGVRTIGSQGSRCGRYVKDVVTWVADFLYVPKDGEENLKPPPVPKRLITERAKLFATAVRLGVQL